MKTRWVSRYFAFVVAIWVVASCSSGSSENDPVLDKAIDRSGVTVGVITAFGSIYVNGVEFDTQGSTIVIDDETSQESQLRVGQVVTVEGLVSEDGLSGDATNVTTDPLVRGPTVSIDAANSQFRILNSLIQVDANTVFGVGFDGVGDIGAIQSMDQLEIHGFFDAQEVVRATLIERTTDQEFELQGSVAGLDVSAQTFSISGQTVDYSGATLVDFQNQISDGDMVEIEGLNIDAAGVLVALRVEREEKILSDTDDQNSEFQIEGVITRYVSSSDFSISSIDIATDGNTKFENGDVADLGLNQRIEVKGTLNGSGVLLADEIEFRILSSSVIEAPIAAVNIQTGTINLLGLEIATNSLTQFIDESDSPASGFSLDDLNVSDFVKVKSSMVAGQSVANLVKRKNPEDKFEVEGPVTDLSEPQLSIGGVVVTTDASTRYEDDAGDITATDFFARIQLDDEVEASGDVNTLGQFVADKLEL